MNPESVEVLLYHNTSFSLEKACKFQLCITWLAKRKIKNTVWFHVVFKLSLELSVSHAGYSQHRN